ncbi:MAG: hypothetical protein ACE37F_25275 [Nannocystaceae bacterium]|nr:hypothetical protein [bacterium]
MASSSNLVPLAVLGIGGAMWWKHEQSKKKAKAKSASASTSDEDPAQSTDAPPDTPPLSPVVPGTRCTQLASPDVLQRWLETTATTAFLELLPTLEDPVEERAQVWDIVDAVWARATQPCLDTSSDAYAQAYKATWCLVVMLLSYESDLPGSFDALASCEDPAFDPYRARPSRPAPTDGGGDGEVPVEPTPPTPPVPQGPDGSDAGPRPPLPPEPVEPIEPVEPPLPDPILPPEPFPVPPGPLGTEGPPLPPPPLPEPVTDDRNDPPSNIESPSTREGISDTSLLRLVAAGERTGQTRARPNTVVLALDPEWVHAEQAIAGLEHFARLHPELMFYVVSLWDTQQHFGLPELLGGLRYILSSANAEGIAWPTPIVGDTPLSTAFAPQPTQWEAVLQHAISGRTAMVGQGSPHPRALPVQPRPGQSLGATLLGLAKAPARSTAPRRAPQPRKKPARRIVSSHGLRGLRLPYDRFANVRLHRRAGT